MLDNISELRAIRQRIIAAKQWLRLKRLEKLRAERDSRKEIAPPTPADKLRKGVSHGKPGSRQRIDDLSAYYASVGYSRADDIESTMPDSPFGGDTVDLLAKTLHSMLIHGYRPTSPELVELVECQSSYSAALRDYDRTTYTSNEQ